MKRKAEYPPLDGADLHRAVHELVHTAAAIRTWKGRQAALYEREAELRDQIKLSFQERVKRGGKNGIQGIPVVSGEGADATEEMWSVRLVSAPKMPTRKPPERKKLLMEIFEQSGYVNAEQAARLTDVIDQVYFGKSDVTETLQAKPSTVVELETYGKI